MPHDDPTKTANQSGHVCSTAELGLVRERCATMHGDGLVGVDDTAGCILPEGHEGPHEFIAADGSHWLWETDMECECEHCMRCEGDYCTTYWKKHPNAEVTGLRRKEDR